MKILYEEDDLIISDTGIVLSGRHIPVRQIISWSVDQAKSLFRKPDPMNTMSVYVTLSSLETSQFFLKRKAEYLAFFPSCDGAGFVKADNLEGLLSLMHERLPNVPPAHFEQSFIEARRRYVGITRALDLMLASKPA